MRQEIVMPKLGLTMTEGGLAEWMVAPGGAVKAGDCLFVVETDKVANEVAADVDAVLLDIVVAAGETVPVGTVIGHLEVQPVAVMPAPAEGGPPAATPDPEVPEAGGDDPAVHDAPGPRLRATPLARRLAFERGVSLASVAGTGPSGRIQARDIEAEATVQAPAAPAGVERAAGETVVRPTATQATVARRLTQAKQETPHFYLAAEAEVTRLLALRGDLNHEPGHPKVTLTHLVVAAAGRALRDFPQFNRVWRNEGITRFDGTDVGVAVNAERGLLVPIVRNAGACSLAEIARATGLLVERTRAGLLTAQDMLGGAITVSNAGMYNVTWMTPIINPGQSMILGVGSVRQVFRPDATGAPALRQELGLVLAADHRLLDGVSGLTVLNAVIDRLERPFSLLI